MTLPSVSFSLLGVLAVKGIVSMAAVLLVIGLTGAIVYTYLHRRSVRAQIRGNPAVEYRLERFSDPASGASAPSGEAVAFTRRSALKLLGAGGVALAAPIAGLSATTPSAVATSQAPASGPGGRVRQWGMVIDLRRCDGCQSQSTAPKCTLACIEGHFAPEPMEWIEVYEAELPGSGTQFIPTLCLQCQNPPCVNVCPVAATYSTPDGVVQIDQDRCIGCRMCMAACPYDRRFFNWGTAPIPPEALLADYSAHHQVPARTGTVMKCDFCVDMVRGGSLPMCVQACPQDAIYYGDMEEDIATNGIAMVGFRDFIASNNTFRPKEELGTQSRVYYIPGHGEDVGRDRHQKGRLATIWPWIERAKGAVTWTR
ncbi:MAG: 4Fe-4S dicluster domain-containing protein [Acidimicrobiia bacterium]